MNKLSFNAVIKLGRLMKGSNESFAEGLTGEIKSKYTVLKVKTEWLSKLIFEMNGKADTKDTFQSTNDAQAEISDVIYDAVSELGGRGGVVIDVKIGE